MEVAGNKPKTRKQRRKEKEAKAAVAARGRAEAQKKKNQELFRMKSLKKSIAKQEALTAQRIEKRKQAKEVIPNHNLKFQLSFQNCVVLYRPRSSSLPS